PPKAELEPGFSHWFMKLTVICKEAGMSAIYFGTPETLTELQEQSNSANYIKQEFRPFVNWEDFLILSREIKANDLFVIIASRKGHVSYNPQLDKMPNYLSTYFNNNSFLMLYPKQLDYSKVGNIDRVDTSLIDSI